MAAKYYVYADGVWRELDLASGRISGWRGRARFVYQRNGKLHKARHRPVIRALKALAIGAPSAAADGPRLPYRSKKEPRYKPRRKSPAVAAVVSAPPVAAVSAEPPAPPCVQQHHCCLSRCNNNDKQNPSRVSPPTPPRSPIPPARSAPHALAINVPHATTAATGTIGPTADTSELNTPLERHAPAVSVDSSSADRARRNRRARAVSGDKTDSVTSSAPCKELLVSEADVAAVRAYVRACIPHALSRFDSDERYMRRLFYSINPLVTLERCARLDRMLGQHFAAHLGLTPRSDTAQGARRRKEQSERSKRSASTDADKENKDKYSLPNKIRSAPVDVVKKSPQLRLTASEPVPPRAARHAVSGRTGRSNKPKKDVTRKVLKTNGDGNDAPKAARGASPPSTAKEATLASDKRVPSGIHIISKRASQANAKEYSNLEDHAIVAWVSGGGRASLVNGNVIWRDLQEQFERLTGRVRSWHSLRNRYLRYILPALGALHLPPGDVARLRAAAATGCIKTKHRPASVPGRNPMFKEPERGASTRGASERRAKHEEADDEPSRDNSDDPSPAKRVSRPKLVARRSLRIQTHETTTDSSGEPTDSKPLARKRSPGKEATHKTSPGKEATRKTSPGKEATRKTSSGKQATRKTSPGKEATRMAFLSKEGTRKTSPSKETRKAWSKEASHKPSSTKEGPRSRRLFNPKANLGLM